MSGGGVSWLEWGSALALSLAVVGVAQGDDRLPADGLLSVSEAAQRVVGFEAATTTKLVYGGLLWNLSFEQPWPMYMLHNGQPRQTRRTWLVDPRSGLVVLYGDSAVSTEAFAEDQPKVPGGTPLGASYAAAVEFLEAHHPSLRLADYDVRRGNLPFQLTKPGTTERGWVVFQFTKSWARYPGTTAPHQSVVMVDVAVAGGGVFGCSVKPRIELPPGKTKLRPAEASAAVALGLFRTPDVAWAKVVRTSPAWYEAVNSGTAQLVSNCLVEYLPAEWYRADRPGKQYAFDVKASNVLVDAAGEVVHRDPFPGYEAKAPWQVDEQMVAAFHAGPATPPPWSVAIGKHSGLLLDRSPLVVDDEPYVPWGYAWLMGVRIYEADGGFALTALKTVKTVALEREGGRYLRLADLATAADAQVWWQPESRALRIKVDYRRPGLDGTEIPLAPDQRPGGAAAKQEP